MLSFLTEKSGSKPRVITVATDEGNNGKERAFFSVYNKHLPNFWLTPKPSIHVKDYKLAGSEQKTGLLTTTGKTEFKILNKIKLDTC